MDSVLMLITALVGWGFCVFVTVESRKDERQLKALHAEELARKDAQIQTLIDQVQLNAQNMPYYPTLGPFPGPTPGPEPVEYDDGMGYLSVTEAELSAALDEISRLD